MASELTDYIIDFLHDDPHTLQCCSFVCRSWLPSCRFHLFREITLLPHEYHGFRKSQNRHPCDNLFALIQESPHIATNVRELHIKEGGRYKNENWVNSTTSLISLLESVTRLKTLHLRRFEWIFLTPELRDALRSTFASAPIMNADFERCSFPLTSFAHLLHACKHLKAFTVREFTVIDREDYGLEQLSVVDAEEAWEQAGQYQLEELRLDREPPEIISWVADSNIFELSRLRTLHCNADFKPLLLGLGESLEHLLLWAPRSCTQNLPLYPVC